MSTTVQTSATCGNKDKEIRGEGAIITVNFQTVVYLKSLFDLFYSIVLQVS